MNLDELAQKYGSDKSSKGHGYVKYYEQHFCSLKDLNLKILELGVREGWSMRMWHDYFPNSIICGIDNDLENLCPASFEEERIIFELGSQEDEKFLDEICTNYGPFDIVVDDASHISPLTIKSYQILFPRLKPGGIYVIEDLHVCDYDKYYLPHGPSTLEFLKVISDNVESKKIYENKIAFIKKCL